MRETAFWGWFTQHAELELADAALHAEDLLRSIAEIESDDELCG